MGDADHTVGEDAFERLEFALESADFIQLVDAVRSQVPRWNDFVALCEAFEPGCGVRLAQHALLRTAEKLRQLYKLNSIEELLVRTARELAERQVDERKARRHDSLLRRHAALLEPVPFPGPHERVERVDMLTKVLQDVPPEELLLLWLREVLELDWVQVASVAKLSVPAAKMRVKRRLEQLRAKHQEMKNE